MNKRKTGSFLSPFVLELIGIAFAYRKSGSGRLRCRTLRQLGFC